MKFLPSLCKSAIYVIAHHWVDYFVVDLLRIDNILVLDASVCDWCSRQSRTEAHVKIINTHAVESYGEEQQQKQ